MEKRRIHSHVYGCPVFFPDKETDVIVSMGLCLASGASVVVSDQKMWTAFLDLAPRQAWHRALFQSMERQRGCRVQRFQLQEPSISSSLLVKQHLAQSILK